MKRRAARAFAIVLNAARRLARLSSGRAVDIMVFGGITTASVGIATWYWWPAALVFSGVCLSAIGLWGAQQPRPP